MKLIREILLEMPMRSGRGLGLLPMDDNTGTGLFVLLQPSTQLTAALRKMNSYEAGQCILGVMELRDNVTLDSWEVDAVFAKPGYGPFLYQAAMSWAGDRGLVSCRSKSQMTPAAKKIWQSFYDGDGSSFAEAVPLESSRHEEPALRHKYVARYPLDVDALFRVGKRAIGHDPLGDKTTLIAEEASSMLREAMQDIYH